MFAVAIETVIGKYPNRVSTRENLNFRVFGVFLSKKLKLISSFRLNTKQITTLAFANK